MFGIPNQDGIFFVFVIDVLLSFGIGLYIDRKESSYPAEYQEALGCLLAAPIFLCLNMIGVAVLVLFNGLGILGPWWSWIVGIATPYILIFLILVQAEKVERTY